MAQAGSSDLMRSLVPLCVLSLSFGCKADVASDEPASTEERSATPTASPASKSPKALGDLEQIRARGTLRILTFGREASLLPRSGNPTLENERLAVDFAQLLDLEPVVLEVDRQADLVQSLLEGRGDLIAAQLTVTPEREEELAFTRTRLGVDEVLVGRTGAAPLQGPKDLAGLEVWVRASSSYAETLRALEEEHEVDIDVKSAGEERNTIDLVEDVAGGALPYTVADSNILGSILEYEDGVEGMLKLAEGRELAWAVRPESEALLQALNTYVLERALTQQGRQSYTADLDEIKERGVLRVLTRNNPVSYFLLRGRRFGFDYELMDLFAKELGVRLQMVVVPSRDKLISALLAGEGDVIAATLTATEKRDARLRFSEPYLLTQEVVVRKKGAEGPSNIGELDGSKIHVRPSSSYYESLEALKEAGAEVEVVEADEALETEALAESVASGEIPLTVMDRHLLEVEQAYGVEIEEAFVLPTKTSTSSGAAPGEVEIGFATRPSDEALGAALDAFVERRYRGLRYNIAKKRYFGASRGSDVKAERVGKTGALSPYDAIIKRYAQRYDFDWRLLAAQAYVESRFDPNAKSWVGARGLFQVMPRTGRSMGFSDLDDPDEGTHAGVKYMSRMMERFDADIALEERIRLSLASYNAGLGHVFDAQRLAERLGKDPHVWFGHVEEAMLLLSKPKYAKQARHGYARGKEPVAYVRHIQELYDAYVKVVE